MTGELASVLPVSVLFVACTVMRCFLGFTPYNLQNTHGVSAFRYGARVVQANTVCIVMPAADPLLFVKLPPAYADPSCKL